MHLLGLFPALALTLAATEPSASSETPPAPSVQAPADSPADATQPRHKGTGLLATTGVLGGTSLAVTIARSVVLKKNCPLNDNNPSQCTYDFGSDIGLAAAQWSLNLAHVGVAPAAGHVLGKYHAWKDAGEGRERNIGAIMGAGGGLLGVGIAGVGTSIALAFVLPTRCVNVEIDSGDPLAGDRCLLKSYPAWTMTNWASFAMISSGAAMLTYGKA
jgi:hypothetical protein